MYLIYEDNCFCVWDVILKSSSDASNKDMCANTFDINEDFRGHSRWFEILVHQQKDISRKKQERS